MPTVPGLFWHREEGTLQKGRTFWLPDGIGLSASIPALFWHRRIQVRAIKKVPWHCVSVVHFRNSENNARPPQVLLHSNSDCCIVSLWHVRPWWVLTREHLPRDFGESILISHPSPNDWILYMTGVGKQSRAYMSRSDLVKIAIWACLLQGTEKQDFTKGTQCRIENWMQLFWKPRGTAGSLSPMMQRFPSGRSESRNQQNQWSPRNRFLLKRLQEDVLCFFRSASVNIDVTPLFAAASAQSVLCVLSLKVFSVFDF